MKVYLPFEYSGGNRGCEAIIKGTSEILGTKREDLIGLSTEKKLDERLGTGKISVLQEIPEASFFWKIFRKFYDHLAFASTRAKLSYWHDYRTFYRQPVPGDAVLFTGGDTLCYDYNWGVDWMNSYFHKKGIKTFMWGCSFGKENMKPQYKEMFRKMTGIYVRESLSYQTFKELGLNNIYLFPDPAFVLKPAECKLSGCFSKDVVGINLSNYTSSNKKLYYANVKKTIDYILSTTDMNVLLIPHVLWKGIREDDRIISRTVKEIYKDNERVSILDSNLLNYCELRYVISNCRFFIGARTHSVISAYSTCRPTVALGYSIKARGIAKDVGLDPKTVVDSKHLTNDHQILDAFKYIQENEKAIIDHMNSFMSEYIRRAWEAKKLLLK